MFGAQAEVLVSIAPSVMRLQCTSNFKQNTKRCVVFINFCSVNDKLSILWYLVLDYDKLD